MMNLKSSYTLLVLAILVIFTACQKKTSNKTAQIISSDLQVDHLNIWVKNPEKAKQKLIDIGFTAIPDSLSEVHHGQGTAGRYFNFLNTYLELIFVHDHVELEQNNKKNKDLDFTKRASFDNNGASPFSIALKVKNYDVDKIPFEKVRYHQDWMKENSSIYAAKNSKLNLKEPSIFVVYPDIAYKQFKKLSDLDTIPQEYAFVKDFYKHKNGAKKLTKISITSKGIDLTTETMKAVKNIENVTIKNGNEHLIELFFDNNIQNKTINLRPDLPLIIHL